ncbi:Predicted kinase, aminoglycoside phosphotransferase (APT) family [Nakamurella panacisegetis]|uniref:Predicted kinase, aminoglycoside phosphotransferase (APT) family n=1 Tax=Nakamurella panacisegetis TaxID=1090615 RepID=A0A1H0QIA3_9ACTN|nr:phosphotransferase family protein [Nakamurella panacisegetis]SDP17052.1 Predicted kinase, aminoglycoside phosphotransferase (APT) family [Nakamurella panacisegetis]
MSTGTGTGLDLVRLSSYLNHHRPDLFRGPLTATLLPGGRSNLTFAVTDGRRELVLRRPPLAHVQAGAHDMSREYRVISALGPSAVPVPVTELICPDPAVIGAPFYLMRRCPGVAYRRRSEVRALGSEALRRLIFDLVDTLVDLHAVDPAAVGLADLGKAAGFNARQLRTWRRQLDGLRSRDLPGIDDLAGRLADGIPEPGTGSLVHGDYRLDNVLVRDGRITAVLDWEMSTLGDPLSDLALLLLYADQPMLAGDGPDDPPSAISSIDGYPAASEVVARYAERSGRDVSHLRWYRAFASFKLAVVLEGVHFRHQHGATLGPGFEGIAEMVQPLIDSGLEILSAPEDSEI